MDSSSSQQGLKVGDLVDTDKGVGVLAYIGTTQFADGVWAGVVLDEPAGKNNGTVQGVTYFECQPNHGIFYLRDKVRLRGSQLTAPQQRGTPSSTMGLLKSSSSNVMNVSTSSSASVASSTLSLSTQKSSASGVPRPPGAAATAAGDKAKKRQSIQPPRVAGGGAAKQQGMGATTTPGSKTKAGATTTPAADKQLGDRQKSFGTGPAGSKLATPVTRQIAATATTAGAVAGGKVEKPQAQGSLGPKKGEQEPSASATGIPSRQATIDEATIFEGDATKLVRRESAVRERARRFDSQNSSVDKQRVPSLSVEGVGHGGVGGAAGAELSHEECVEIEYLRREVKDLNEKLETLREKRRGDQECLKEYERNKIHLQTLMEFKTEMIADHSSLKAKYEELEREYAELKRDFEANTDVNKALEQLAIVEVDKEMAEERVEMLKAELTQAEEAKRDLIEELALLKEELELVNATMEHPATEGVATTDDASSTSESGGTAALRLHSKQMEQQNERLKEAIIHVRDALGRTNEELEILRVGQEQARSERDELAQLYERVQKELEEARETVSTLREEADSAMGAERMISTLTDRNLDLEDRIRVLEEDRGELELLRQMDEEIMETLKETERDLRAEMDQQLVAASALRRQLAEGDRRAEDLELVLRKFRQKQADLNEVIQQQKDEILTLKEEQDQLSSRGVAGDDEPISLRSIAANRAFTEVIEAECSLVELESSRQQSAYLRNFLPDNFTRAGGDNDCLLLCVLFPRLTAKCNALQRLLTAKYPLVSSGLRREHITLSHRAEQWAHVRKFNYALRALHATTMKFESVLKACSVERLSRLAIQQLEISGQERHLDAYLELLKQNRFDENTAVDQLERVTNFLQKLFATNLSGEAFNCREAMVETLQQMAEGLQWAQFNVQRMKFLLLEAETSESVAQSDFIKAQQALSTGIAECQSLVVRSLNRMPAENDLMISSELNDRVLSAIAQLERAARVLHDTCSFAASQLSMIDAAEGFTSAQMREMLNGSAEKLGGAGAFALAGQRSSSSSISSATSPSSASLSSVGEQLLRESFEQLRDFLDSLSESLENSSMEIPPSKKTGFPPLLERAHTRKLDAVEAEGLRWQLAKKDEELLKLQKALKAREGDLSTMRLRLEMADKQMAEAGSGKSAEGRLQQRINQLQEDFLNQKEDYERSIEALQALLEQAEREREKERERAKDFSKKALFANMSQNLLIGGGSGSTSPLTPTSLLASFGGGGMGGAGMANPIQQQQQAHLYQQELALLDREYRRTLQDLKWAERRVRELEAQHAAQLLTDMGDLEVPEDPVCGVYSLRKAATTGGGAAGGGGPEAELQRMIKESEQLMTESTVNLLEPLEAKKREVFRERAAMINDRIESLKFRFHRYWTRRHPGEDYPCFTSSTTAATTMEGVRQVEQNERKAAHKPRDPSAQAIMEKWRAELSAGEKWYEGAVLKAASTPKAH